MEENSNIHYGDTYLWENQITFIETADDSSTFSIKTISMDGQLLNQPIKKQRMDYQRSIQKDGKLYFMGKVHSNGEYIQKGMEYNLETFELKDNQSVSDYFNIRPISDEFYAYKTQEYTSPLIIKNKEHKTLYILENTVLEYASSTYMVVNVSDPITYDSKYQVVEIATGKVMKTYSDRTQFKFVSDNMLYAMDSTNNNTAPSGRITTGQLIVLGDEPPTKDTYDAYKQWTITFNADVDATTVDSKTVYVMDSKGNLANVLVSVQGNQLFVLSPQGGYTSGETYTLHVKQDIKSVTGVMLKAEESKIFTIK